MDLPKFLFCDDGDEGRGRHFVLHFHTPRFLVEFAGDHATAPVLLDGQAAPDDLVNAAARFYRQQTQGAHA